VSNTHRTELDELFDTMQAIGFKLKKRSPGHNTLQAYPLRIHQHPLVNPRFTTRKVAGRKAHVLEMAVWSKPDPDLAEYLNRFGADEESWFERDEALIGGDQRHGYFVITLGPVGKPPQILECGPVMARIHSFLRLAPARAARGRPLAT
jgi:hypothetical protein